MENYVWYAGYGSNLSEQRFNCYIECGKPRFGKICNKGCCNKTLPISNEIKEINHRLYFALPERRTKTDMWGCGGVAFICPEKDGEFNTLCRMWKITENQYIEVRCQEGLGWYNKEILLGEKDGCPIKTITQYPEFTNLVRPSDTYIKTIAEGLNEVYDFDRNKIADYLLEKNGIKNEIDRDELLQIINNKRT